MRKIKVNLKCVVPSWNYCNHDSATASLRPSKEICRFCSKDKFGYRCALFDENLSADANFIYKTAACINATAGFKTTVEEQQQALDLKSLLRETIEQRVEELVQQKYPRTLAETVALKEILEDK